MNNKKKIIIIVLIIALIIFLVYKFKTKKAKETEAEAEAEKSESGKGASAGASIGSGVDNILSGVKTLTGRKKGLLARSTKNVLASAGINKGINPDLIIESEGVTEAPTTLPTDRKGQTTTKSKLVSNKPFTPRKPNAKRKNK